MGLLLKSALLTAFTATLLGGALQAHSDTPESLCGGEATPISDVQGTSDVSPLKGRKVVIEGVVSGSFSHNRGLGGFFVEEEVTDRDDREATSEGLFVYAPKRTVRAGHRMRIAGKVVEYKDLTELTSVSSVTDCGPGQLPAPAVVTLPWSTPTSTEALESMRVRFADALTVNDTYNLGRFGSLTLGNHRHYAPTSVALPGTEAQAVERANQRDQLVLDDGSSRQNPAMVPYPTDSSASRTVRAGDQVTDLVGILDFRFGKWRFQPVQPPRFVATNPRPATPDLEDTGNLVVASFNILNFFNGNGAGGGFPTARGANSAREFQRQTAKLISAIHGAGADIVGLMELENDGYDDISAIARLAAELGDEWTYVDPGFERLGRDEIAVGFVYRRDRAQPVGQAATLATGPFRSRNRQPLAQTFRPIDSDDGVTVVVNHFKSRNCGEASGPEADQGDGQGCWNPTRTRAAKAIIRWLATDPTRTGETDILITGDLNSYAKENPITTLIGQGYTNLVAEFMGDGAYSYVYYGDAGYLDHALANKSLSDKVVATTVWAINADEPRLLDYNTEHKTRQQEVRYYSTGPWRSSDHDPVIVALELGADQADTRVDGPKR